MIAFQRNLFGFPTITRTILLIILVSVLFAALGIYLYRTFYQGRKEAAIAACRQVVTVAEDIISQPRLAGHLLEPEALRAQIIERAGISADALLSLRLEGETLMELTYRHSKNTTVAYTADSETSDYTILSPEA